jgi:predicted O-linked N-acetylglucosamine transferase (SPINDLY family)
MPSPPEQTIADIQYRLREGSYAEALRQIESSLITHPDDVNLHYFRGLALHYGGLFAAAADSFRLVHTAVPTAIPPALSLATSLAASGNRDAAAEVLVGLTRTLPNELQPRKALVELFLSMGRTDLVRPQAQRIAELLRTDLNAWLHAIFYHFSAGDLDATRAVLKTAVSCLSNDAGLSSMSLWFDLYDPSLAPDLLLSNHKQWATKKCQAPSFPHQNPNGEIRPLKIAFVSDALHDHPIGRFMIPLLEGLRSSDQFQINLFSFRDAQDPVSQRLRSLADSYVLSPPLDSDHFINAVRTRSIDILVDLMGHSSRLNMLQSISRRLAPLQVHYLGHPASTAIPNLDVYVTDSHCAPSGSDHLYTEKLLRLPRCFCSWFPYENAPLPSDSPVLSNHHITFGSFHSLAKINQPVIELWAQVLRAVPNSRLRLVRDELVGNTAIHYRSRFESLGIHPSRIETVVPSTESGKHLVEYAHIDIMLDVFPYTGHTTSIEALYLGVPIVTLAPADRLTHAHRMVASILHHASLSQLVASTATEFVQIASSLASDLAQLQSFRTNLRKQLTLSGLINDPAVGQHFARELISLWNARCQAT